MTPAPKPLSPFLCLGSSLILICSLASAAAASPQHDAALDAYLELWSGGDLGRLESVVTADFRRHARAGEAPTSPAELRSLILSSRELYRKPRIQVLSRSTDDHDRGILVAHFTGGYKDTDRAVRMLMAAFYRFAEGRVAEEWVLSQNLPTMLGLGYQLAPPGFEIQLPGEEAARLISEQVPAAAASPAELAAQARLQVLELRARPPVDAEAQAGRELVLDYAQVWNSGSVQDLEQLVHTEFRRQGGKLGEAASRAELQDLILEARRFHPGLSWQVEDVFAHGDVAALRMRVRGSYGDTGRQLDYQSFALYRLAQGQITQEHVLSDAVAYSESLGYVVIPPGTKMIPPAVEPMLPVAQGASPGDGADAVELLRRAAAELAGQGRGKGELHLSSSVTARILVDGRELGVLPAQAEVVLELSRGRRQLRALSRAGAQLMQRELKVARAAELEARIESPARLAIDPRRQLAEDLQTGLLWPLTDNGKDIDWQGAQSYCEELEHGGYSDWRLPAIEELVDLYEPDSDKKFPTLKGITLSGCCPWGIEPHRGDMAWIFVSYKGARYLQYRRFASGLRALCVRDQA